MDSHDLNRTPNQQQPPHSSSDKGYSRLKNSVHSYPGNVILADGTSLLENSNYPVDAQRFLEKASYPYIQTHFHQHYIDNGRLGGDKEGKGFRGHEEAPNFFFSNSEGTTTQKNVNVHNRNIDNNAFLNSSDEESSNNPNYSHLPIHNLPPCKSINHSDIGDNNECKIILEAGPGCHQIKEYNIRPVNVIRVNYTPRNSDILVVKLMCDPAMKLKDCEFFLTAMSDRKSVV